MYEKEAIIIDGSWYINIFYRGYVGWHNTPSELMKWTNQQAKNERASQESKQTDDEETDS